MKIRLLSLMVLTHFTMIQLFSQTEKLIGFWEVKSVSVGDQSMTPVAKWTKINEDGSFQSGNGWVQSSAGTWNYEQENKSFTANDELGIIDEFGGFEVSFQKDEMIWKRKEEGIDVTVTLSPIKALPMSPSDYLKGLWEIVDTKAGDSGNEAHIDENRMQRLLFRWDRIYSDYTKDGQKLSGYWHINSHKPEITLLPFQEGREAESWLIIVNKEELKMTGISDTNRGIVRTFKRRKAH